MDPPESNFKKLLVDKYLNQSPLKFQLSNQPRIVDITQDKKDLDINIKNQSEISMFATKEDVCNYPRVNQFMVERGKNKI